MKSSTVLRTKALVSAIAVSLGGFAAAAEADTLQDMKAQIEAPQKKVLEFEQKQQTAEQKQPAAAPDKVVTGGHIDPQRTTCGEHHHQDENGNHETTGCVAGVQVKPVEDHTQH